MSEEPGAVFDRVAEEYDRVRPGYPATLVDAACAEAGLGPGSRVVEVGCGTGKLTVMLARRDLDVDAVDRGSRMVEIARRHVGGAPVRFHVGRFEDLALPDDGFDALFSATAFHWIDPAVAWTKAAQLLRPGGVLALLSHVGGSNGGLDEEFQAAWRGVLPDAPPWDVRDAAALRAGAEPRTDNVSELWGWLTRHDLGRPEAAALFRDARLRLTTLEREETAPELIELLRTTSTYLGLDPGRQQQLDRRITAVIERAGGSYLATVFAILVTAHATE
jgi:ubiquinone/menaquinone biosynthesis C-methylase UbiE